MLNFSLIGAAGYVAPRHMRAIKETGNELISVYDVHDGLAVLDQYFPHAACFSDLGSYTVFHKNRPLDFVSICSPNHLHFQHISWALQQGANVICEKPLVLDPLQLDELAAMERMYNRKIYTILQLRLVEAVMALKKKVQESAQEYDVDVNYISARGNWYFNSWKGDEKRSGGIVTNIGIHLFDLLLWIFGPVKEVGLFEYGAQRARGTLHLERAKVRWFLSIDENDLPSNDKRSFREMKVEGQAIRLDEGMEVLHNQCYASILKDGGYRIEDARPSIELCHQIRQLANPLIR
jgi:UDP-N-acetyl-2-amino-2-deoxyglucuronate dehydrogenase